MNMLIVKYSPFSIIDILIMKKTKKTLGFILIISAVILFILHFTLFMILANTETEAKTIRMILGYFSQSSMGSFLLFIGILIFSGVYLLRDTE
jgi:hypothetical protein